MKILLLGRLFALPVFFFDVSSKPSLSHSSFSTPENKENHRRDLQFSYNLCIYWGVDYTTFDNAEDRSIKRLSVWH